MSGYTRKDAAYRAAKRSGYRSRAAWKLIELDQRTRIFRPGARVVDLGCWPGGWLQVASERVGAEGIVVGVDLERVDALSAPNVRLVQGDARDRTLPERVRAALGGAADVVLCDMAPKLSGVRVADHARHLALVECAILWAKRTLAPDGVLVVKLFSSLEQDATALLRSQFGEVKLHRPGSTRKGSSEIYAVARRPQRECPA